ncbi:MAG: protein phosphatase 2C domain-containing protein [Polaromonas sp.]|uniref:PP2C family serine/threonine-protein phosphatase n=1 Tax=Polaromonas sp. TaxID=1869339 RepID=UPI0025D43C11|nr:PP2C family serine/threonine-protein phosphatase [Polaromonas sp.]MBI2726201.1 protein phosphatase 2C domain-containing protein [Polaromonas sp.]
MSWTVVSASVIGTSHIARSQECQDDCWAFEISLADGRSALVVFVADGAGSASNGGEGARLAIQSAVKLACDELATPGFVLNEELAGRCVETVRETIQAEAWAQQKVPRDFACTFLGVVAIPDATLVMQIGDGGIVMDVGDGLELAVIPMNGEYANMTNFVTDENALSLVTTRLINKAAGKIAAFTDGVQRLALNMTENTPHEPFFKPFFDVLSKSSEDQTEQLGEALASYLGSEPVNARTDDDKTLALAVRLESV